MNNFFQHIRLLRPLNLLVSALSMIVCASILNGLDNHTTLLLTILVVVCYNAAANIYNDLLDLNTDSVNHPQRPLVSGFVKAKTAKTMTIILFVIGTISTLGLNLQSKIIAVALALPALIIYSKYLKGTPLFGNALVGIILGLAFIFSGAAYGHITRMVVPALLAFGLTFVRELIKDIADFEGDKIAGLNTFPVSKGIQTSVHVITTAAIIIGASALIPYAMGYYGLPYLIVLVLGVEIPLLFIVVSFLKEPIITNAKRFSGVLKFSTIAGLLAFFIDHYVR